MRGHAYGRTEPVQLKVKTKGWVQWRSQASNPEEKGNHRAIRRSESRGYRPKDRRDNSEAEGKGRVAGYLAPVDRGEALVRNGWGGPLSRAAVRQRAMGNTCVQPIPINLPQCFSRPDQVRSIDWGRDWLGWSPRGLSWRAWWCHWTDLRIDWG